MNIHLDNSERDNNIAPFKRNNGKGKLAALEQALNDEIARYRETVQDMRALVDDLNEHHPRLKHPKSIRMVAMSNLVQRNNELTDFGLNIVRYLVRWDYLPSNNPKDNVLRSKPLLVEPDHFMRLADEFPIDGVNILGALESRRLEINHRFKAHLERISSLLDQIDLARFIRSKC